MIWLEEVELFVDVFFEDEIVFFELFVGILEVIFVFEVFFLVLEEFIVVEGFVWVGLEVFVKVVCLKKKILKIVIG